MIIRLLILMLIAAPWIIISLTDPDYRKIHARFGNTDFYIPRYVLDSPSVDRPLETALLLYALPNYTPWEKISYSDRTKLSNSGYWAQMLLENQSTRPPIDTMVKNRRAGLTEEKPTEPLDNLEGYKWYHNIRGVKYLWSTIYLEKDISGKIISFIECSAPGNFKKNERLTCQHKFTDKGILFNITYNKKRYLNHWQEMRTSAIKYVHSFKDDQAAILDSSQIQR